MKIETKKGMENEAYLPNGGNKISEEIYNLFLLEYHTKQKWNTYSYN